MQTFIYPTHKTISVYIGFFSQLAVMVFFVLSGFLIGKSICNNISRNGNFKLVEYTKDRLIRLYPPLIASIILMTILTLLAPIFFLSGTNKYLKIEGYSFVREAFTTDPIQIFGALGFLNGFYTTTPLANGPLWSLPFEFWYYAIAAALFLKPKKVSTGSFIAISTLIITYNNQLFYMLTPIWFAGFGVAIAHQKKINMQKGIFYFLFWALTFCLILSIWLVFSQKTLGTSVWLDRMNHFRVVSGLWFASYLILIISGRAHFTTLFHKTASFSYTLYVVHFPIMLFILGMCQEKIITSTLNALTTAAASISITLPVAIIISRFVENKPLIESVLSTSRKQLDSEQ